MAFADFLIGAFVLPIVRDPRIRPSEAQTNFRRSILVVYLFILWNLNTSLWPPDGGRAVLSI